MTTTVYILIGIPGCGKSTEAARIRERYPDAVTLSSDDIIEEIAQERAMTYNEVFADNDLREHAMARYHAHVKIVAASVKSTGKPSVVIVDRTNLTAKARKHIFDAFESVDVAYCAICFDRPVAPAELVEWKRRLASRPGKTIPCHVLDTMMSSWTAPSPEEVRHHRLAVSYINSFYDDQ